MGGIARVIVDVALDREFDYLIPDELASAVRPGTPVRVPFGPRTVRGLVVGLAPRSSHDKLKPIAAVLSGKSLVSDALLGLARWMADYYAAPLEPSIQTVLPASVRRAPAAPLRRLRAAPTEAARAPGVLDALRRRAPRQAAALAELLDRGPAFLADMARRAGAAPAIVRELERKGLVAVAGETQTRDPHAGHTIVPTEPLTLMPDQQTALDLVRQSMDTLRPPVVLLHGVTGSGKTEVYLQAIRHALDTDRGAIVLVPEIALTPQTVERFRGRFGDGVAILHSHLSDGERHDEWHRIHDGAARIAIGARSALFAPVRNLGLIVVDEEHEGTYKQEEAPRYHARDMAVLRGHREKCAVVLGSATPSLESWQNAQNGKYALAALPHRVDHREMPRMTVVDMRIEAEREGRPNVLSKLLVDALADRLARAEQTLLFLNRRGYATSRVCPACGEVARCAACSVALVYHKGAHRLVCHLCGARQPPPERCPNPNCRDPAFRFAGAGTERVEEVLKRCFPHARIARMDSDTMTRKEAYHQALGAVRAGKVDILVGTQMIAKGLHFPGITLVGVVNADVSLHMPDFRAGERTFQLLTQVAGRAGRGDLGGEVIVQTYTPFHPAIQAARRLDYAGFCAQELEFRRELRYPPFTHLVCLHIRGADETAAAGAARDLHAALAPRLDADVELGDPAPAPIARVKGQYRFQLMLRAPQARRITAPLREVWKTFRWPKGVAGAVDVDAINLL